MESKKNVAILGGGNIGLAIAKGLETSNLYPSEKIYITKRKIDSLNSYAEKGFKITENNKKASADSEILIIAVQPKQLSELLTDIKDVVDEKRHLIISVVSGASIKMIKELIGKNVEVIRAMPNTAIAIHESMTCLAADTKTNGSLTIAKEIFDYINVGLYALFTIFANPIA